MVNFFTRIFKPGFFRLNFTNTSSERGLVTPSEKKQPWSTLLTFEETTTLNTLLFHWADSYDSKDWARLSTILAPVLLIDYTLVNGKLNAAMPAGAFLDMISSPGFLGDPLLKTQHLLGACQYERVGEGEVVGRCQLRAGHLRFEDETHKVETKRGHSHATNEFYFKRIWVEGEGKEGAWEWKWAGLKPEVRWNEYEFETIFGGFEAPRV